MRRGEKDVEAYLPSFPEDIRVITERMRELVKAALPGISEALYPGWKVIGYRISNGSKTFYFGFVAPRPGAVILGFEYGTLLHDREGLLEGSGRQVRQITIRRKEEIDEAACTRLIVEAALVARSRGDV